VTLQQAVAVLGRVVPLLALVASGVYTLLYLWRWEWERAQIAGVFFLASLVMLSTQLILRRLDSLPGSGSPGDDTHSAATVVPSKPFAWTEPDQNTYIFLPVLLGFGVALSVLAAAAERLVAYALGGTGPGRRRPERPLPQILIVGLLVAGLVATAATVVIARDRLMTRPETPMPGERTYLLEVKRRGIDVDVVDTVRTLALTCRDRGRVPALSVVDVRATAPDTATLTVEPVLGRYGAARFEGCLTDAVLERRVVGIVRITTDADEVVTAEVPASDS
jgi:hypothetical protein